MTSEESDEQGGPKASRATSSEGTKRRYMSAASSCDYAAVEMPELKEDYLKAWL